MSPSRALAFSTVAFLLTGCASQIQTTVTRFHAPAMLLPAPTFRIEPTELQKGSLQFETYSRLVASKLAANGWRNDDPPGEPDRIVFFTYAIDAGQAVSGSTPIFGQTGGGISQSYGVVTSGTASANYSGTIYTAPTYGVVGSVHYTTTIYRRLLLLDVIDGKSGEGKPAKLFEAKVVSNGTSPDLSTVVPAMIESMFRHFPGENGRSETISIPMR